MVSLIVATNNREDLLEEQLLSVVKQSYTNWECIIIDDCEKNLSKESLLNLIKSDFRFKFFKRLSKYPKGLSGSRNMGLDEAKGRFIQFIDDDDVCHPRMLELKVNLIQKNDCDFVVTTLAKQNHRNFSSFFASTPSENFEKIKKIGSFDALDVFNGKFQMASVTPLLKKEVFLNSRFDVNLNYGEEAVLNMNSGWSLLFVPYLCFLRSD